MVVREELSLGIDLGIASVGWAVLDAQGGCVLGAGARLFEAPETPKERTPKNQIRRQKRLLRRVIRRKRQRMSLVRSILARNGIVDAASPAYACDERAVGGSNPWELRAAALERPLCKTEAARVVVHFAAHRGFQSNRKGGDNAIANPEDQKALAAMAQLADKIAPYRTFGVAMHRDPELSQRQRNRKGDYGRTPRRDWLRAELSLIFQAQEKLGATWATSELHDALASAIFTQRPLQNSEHLLRDCPFEADEKRASKAAPSFERFRLLQRLAHIRLWRSGAPDRALTPVEIAHIEQVFLEQKSVSWKTLRAKLDLAPDVRFRGISTENEKHGIAARTGSGGQGSHTLLATLGADVFERIELERLDKAIHFIAFRESIGGGDGIRAGLESTGLEPDDIEKLCEAVASGAFSFATGAAHISAKACRNLIPHLRSGLVYSEACAMVGYDHSAPDSAPLVRLKRPAHRRDIVAIFADDRRSPINSPVARKALIEGVKQIWTVIQEHPSLRGDLPGRIHVELARDVGRSADERAEISRGLERRNKYFDALRLRFAEYFGREPRRDTDELLRLQLAEEQNWRTVYTDQAIDKGALLDGQSYQIDHILPWGRFGDDSFINLTLCTASENQQKGDRTPFEWIGNNLELWAAFVARVEGLKFAKGRKKRNYSLKNASEVEEAFRNRNLNDTRWACRLLIQAADAFYPPEPQRADGKATRRTFARPAAITAKLRKAWGLEDWKKDQNGRRREDDRHHALDAIITAACSEAMLQRLTLAHQAAERLGKGRPFEQMDPPWPEFRDQVIQTLEDVFVSRSERRRARGQAHLETIQAVSSDGATVFASVTPTELLGRALKAAGDGAGPDALKIAIEALLEKPERSRAITRAVLDWHTAGAKEDAPPKGPTGDQIRKIRIIDSGTKPAVSIRGGTAARGDMVRVDVFTKANPKGRKEYFLVPIYPHQVADAVRWPQPPSKAIAIRKPEAQWIEVDETFDFQFSVSSGSYLEATTAAGEVWEGYLIGINRDDLGMEIGRHENRKVKKKLGARTLLNLKKYNVDRLGRRTEVTSEVRTWRGVPCISARPPGSP